MPDLHDRDIVLYLLVCELSHLTAWTTRIEALQQPRWIMG